VGKVGTSSSAVGNTSLGPVRQLAEGKEPACFARAGRRRVRLVVGERCICYIVSVAGMIGR